MKLKPHIRAQHKATLNTPLSRLVDDEYFKMNPGRNHRVRPCIESEGPPNISTLVSRGVPGRHPTQVVNQPAPTYEVREDELSRWLKVPSQLRDDNGKQLSMRDAGSFVSEDTLRKEAASLVHNQEDGNY